MCPYPPFPTKFIVKDRFRSRTALKYSGIPHVLCSKTIKSAILIDVFATKRHVKMMRMTSNNSQCDVKTIKMFQMLLRCEGISKEAHTFSRFWGLKWRPFVVK